MITEILEKIPLGYSEVLYQNRKYGLTKSAFNQGRSYKIYAKELGGKDFISLNIYLLTDKTQIKPCEMPEQKVIHFLNNIEIL